MEKENNKIPEEYKEKGYTKNYLIMAFVILIILVIIWAFATKRLP